MELNTIISYDYEVEDHKCDVGSSSLHTFVNAQELIDDCLEFIQEAYQEGSDLYMDADPCIHGHRIKIMLTVTGIVANPQGVEVPRVITFDIFNHQMSYAQMLQNFQGAQQGVQKITALFN